MRFAFASSGEWRYYAANAASHSFTHRHNARHKLWGHLFGERYKAAMCHCCQIVIPVMSTQKQMLAIAMTLMASNLATKLALIWDAWQRGFPHRIGGPYHS